MKKLIYIAAIADLNIILFGAIFKVLHWPGAQILLTLGVFLFCFLVFPVMLLNHYRTLQNHAKCWLYIVIYITVIVDFTGMIFKILHWPGAGYMLIFALLLPFVVFMPVYIYFHQKSETKSYTEFGAVMALLIYVAVISVFLALNVSKNILDNLVVTGQQIHKNLELVTEQNNALARQIHAKDSMKASNIDLISQKTDRLIKQIEILKTEIVSASNNHQKEYTENAKIVLADIPFKENTSAVYDVLLDDKKGKSQITLLQESVENYKTEMSSIVNDKNIVSDLSVLLAMNDASVDDNLMTWEENLFGGKQLITAINHLNLLELKIRLSESVCLKWITKS